MSWKLSFSKEFSICLKRFKLRVEYENLLKESIKRWINGENNLLQEQASNKLIVQENQYYIFEVKLANQAKGRESGKSGGYRLIMIYNKNKESALAGMIWKRQELHWKGKSGKRDNEKKEYIESLKKKIRDNIR